MNCPKMYIMELMRHITSVHSYDTKRILTGGLNINDTCKNNGVIDR